MPVKTINSLARANVKSRNGLVSANLKTINGVDAVLAGGPFGGLVDVTNLSEWWPLSEASGTRLGVHAGLDLTDNNTVTGGNDGVAYSQFTPANGEYLSRVDAPSLSAADIDFAWLGWVRLTNKNNICFQIKGSALATASFEYAMWYSAAADNYRFSVSNGSVSGAAIATTFGSPPTDAWTFLVGWHDATANTINIQVNNGTADSASYSSGSWDSTLGFELGRGGSTGFFHDGRMRRVGVWKNGFPDATEKTALYGAGAGLDY